jgi:hypothetical protein
MTQFKFREVGEDDIGEVTGIFTDAYMSSEIATWLVPAQVHRRALFAVYFCRVAEHVVRHGIAQGAAFDSDGLDAVALWLRAGDPAHVNEVGYTRWRATVFGVDTAERFAALETAMFPHNAPPAEHLAFLGVRPTHHTAGLAGARLRSTGLAGALLRHHIARLDAHRLPARTHALDPYSRALLAANGYTDDGEPIDLRGGPRIVPMWREPAP